jgi:hypothetical protein
VNILGQNRFGLKETNEELKKKKNLINCHIGINLYADFDLLFIVIISSKTIYQNKPFKVIFGYV